ncbi:cyclodeaminase/cyclohydrolase family protein [Alkaliphilus hydrothermalis]|uniref:Formiminotetrahydrofolate cyclodeaminase n=1 Tax=Alkaliphilus hydrothermalis TaxID=1482730 RepID=A0ABS2NMN0_9FIRM|nr:cyclodeaminase/cyclohydrolase family protein [Alkaliphilus hydrothermalis]MBM7614205.1 formiminotetrahydrofolate cyclodeaminase [Alkaliphilus hydrothermalis]
MLASVGLNEFLNKTASSDPVPGGGSAAALSGATAAALTEMVAKLTVGKKKYVEVEEEMKAIAEKAASLREKLMKDIDRDADSFNEVMGAFKLPKETDEEKATRSKSIQEATKKAAEVPLEVAKDAFGMMEMIEAVVVKGNASAVTDGAVAAMMARTAVLSAIYNVKINLSSIKDEAFVADLTQQVKQLEEAAVAKEQVILGKVML